MSKALELQKITKTFSSDISIDEGERAVIAKISTIAVDRDGEVLLPMGCNFKDFEKNPVVMYSHRYEELPVGRCVAIKRDEKGIVAKTIFAARPDDLPESEPWLPDILFSLYKQGVLNAWSVGIDPFSGYERRVATKKDTENFGESCRAVVSKWKIWEYSACNIPANQEAVTLAVAKGIITANDMKAVFGDIEMKHAEEVPTVIEQKPAIKKYVFMFAPTPVTPKKVPNVEQIVKRTMDKARGKVFLIQE